jgi:hypothetical protein
LFLLLCFDSGSLCFSIGEPNETGAAVDRSPAQEFIFATAEIQLWRRRSRPVRHARLRPDSPTEMPQMRPINAMILAMLGSVATFGAEYELFPPRLHAAPFTVPNTPDWRRQAIDSYPGGTKIDHLVARLSDRLELSAAQASQFRALLEHQREQTLALLVAGPSNLTRTEFITRRHQMWAKTRKQIDALLTPDQVEILRESTPSA